MDSRAPMHGCRKQNFLYLLYLSWISILILHPTRMRRNNISQLKVSPLLSLELCLSSRTPKACKGFGEGTTGPHFLCSLKPLMFLITSSFVPSSCPHDFYATHKDTGTFGSSSNPWGTWLREAGPSTQPVPTLFCYLNGTWEKSSGKEDLKMTCGLTGSN